MKRKTKIFGWAIGVKLLITGILIFDSCSFTQNEAVVLYKSAESNKPYDVVIVPGVPYEKGKTNAIMKFRVYWSYILFKKGIAKNVIYSGASVYTPYSEGKIMSLFGRAYGIPKGHIFAEIKAEHSTENLYYSYWLARKKGFTKIALASDPAQTAFLKRWAKKKKLQVDFIPMVYDYVNSIPYVDPSIPDTLYVTGNFIPIYDRENALERFRGTLGLNIDSGKRP
jgi:hypothetical protein